MLIALDIGHRGKPSSPADRGAAGEMALAFPYWLSMDSALRAQGFQVLGPFHGEYRERIRYAHERGAGLFLQIHADAGGGRRSTVWHDARSLRGADLAQDILDCVWAPDLGDAGNWSMVAGEAGPDSNGVPGDEGERPYSVLSPVYPLAGIVGLLWEVGFADGPARHREILVQHQEEICGGVARGIRAWAK